jgi:RimJ/RimL family protein N-acetyltransferase
MYFKKMIGSKVYLSPLNSDDFLDFTKWVNDADSYIGLVFSNSIIGAQLEKEILDRLSKEYNFAIVDIQTDKVIGTCGLVKPNFIERNSEVGIFIGDSNYHNKGFGSEALALLLDYGFNLLNFDSMFLRVYEYNKNAISAYEKVGFKHSGRLRRAKIAGSRHWDVLFMDIMSDEFDSPYVQRIIDKKLGI